MDELTIGDKIYISSKQAAKITGYAKDYVGQLCREGRVDARLVGRNWYVLESSIREHRFGAESKPETVSTPVEETPAVSTRSWEPPTYASVKEETLLPPLVPQEKPVVAPETAEAVALMQDAWKEWFAAREGMITPEPEVEAPTESPAEDVEDEEAEVDLTPMAEVRASDISSKYNVSEVSQPVEEGSRVSLTRIEEEPVEEIEVTVTPTYTPRPVAAPVEHRPAKGVIDLSRTHEAPYEAVVRSGRIVRRRRARRGNASLIVQSVLLSAAGLAIVVAVIGSGALESLSSTQAVNESLRGAIFDALRGETRLEK